MRSFMEELHGSGVDTGRPAAFSHADRQNFANALDRELARNRSHAGSRHAVNALRVPPRVVTRWLKWLADDGVDRLAGIAHYWSSQRLPKAQEDAFHQAVEQLQHSRGGGRVRGEDIRQLLVGQFGVAYTLNGAYELLNRLDMAWISVRSVSPNANPAKQAEFKKSSAQQGLAVLPPDVPLEQVETWFQDEMRIGQRGTQTRSGRAEEHGRG
jgi:transposase